MRKRRKTKLEKSIDALIRHQEGPFGGYRPIQIVISPEMYKSYCKLIHNELTDLPKRKGKK